VRLLSVRHPLSGRRGLARVGLAGSLALVSGVVTAGVVARANDVASSYGDRRLVPVAVRDLASGDEITEADVDWRSLPVDLIGGTVLEQPVGRTVVAPVLRSEVVVTERVGPEGIRGPMAIAPEGSRAVAIPVREARPPVVLGDHVDVVGVTLDGLARSRRIASDAVVVAVTEEAVTVAVHPDELAATARAVLEGSAVVALVGAG
jgi:Flp pilus assembly protein CpaB